ncbi:hypothetical protein [Sphingobacterium mizutaii]|nr:hypothetical protein [Sphingobacterium mizutaii]
MKASKANAIAHGNGILSILPPLEMSRGLKASFGRIDVCRKPLAGVESL